MTRFLFVLLLPQFGFRDLLHSTLGIVVVLSFPQWEGSPNTKRPLSELDRYIQTKPRDREKNQAFADLEFVRSIVLVSFTSPPICGL